MGSSHGQVKPKTLKLAFPASPLKICSVSVLLAKRFLRRRLKCEKKVNRRRTPSDGKKFTWPGELEITVLGNYRSTLYLNNSESAQHHICQP